MGKKANSEALKEALVPVENQRLEEQSRKERESVPDGWESSATWDSASRSGSLTTGPMWEAPGPEGWSDLLAKRGMDPDVYEIDGNTIQFTSWDGWRRDPVEDPDTGKIVGYGAAYSAVSFSYRATLRLKPGKSDGLNPDWDKLLEETKKASRKAFSKRKRTGRAVTLVVNLADFQLGNPDGGGVESQFMSLQQIAPGVRDLVTAIQKRGDHVDELVVAGMGDLVENCTGFYPNMEFLVELNHRDQAKIVRRFLRDFLMDIADLCDRIVVLTVPGNHGEKRKEKGGSYSDVGDNTDVEVFEQVAEILAVNPKAFGHIEFRIPNHEVAVSYETKGKLIAFTHGHMRSTGTTAALKVWNWWKGQTMGRAYADVAHADILVAGHYHHLNVVEQEGRLMFICPSLTDVGKYFADATGYRTNPGVLCFEVVEDVSGVADFNVIRFVELTQ